MKPIALSLLLLVLATDADAQYALQFGSAVAVSDREVLVGEGRNLLEPGAVYSFGRSSSGEWTLTETLTAGGSAADGFGRALASDGSRLAVGAPAANRVYLFQRVDGRWTQTAVLAGTEDGFGTTLALSGNHLLVGAPGNRQTPGTVQAYGSVDGYEWLETGAFQAGEPVAGDGFGAALAVSGGHAVIGAPQVSGRRGEVAVLAFGADGAASLRPGVLWVVSQTLNHPDAREGDGFGAALALREGQLAVGAPGRNARSGSVALYRFSDGKWEPSSSLAPFEATSGEAFGTSLALQGDALLVGAPGYGARQGALYRFQYDATTGRMTGTQLVHPESAQFRAGLGGALAVGRGLVAAGATGQDNFEGSVYVWGPQDEALASPRQITHDSGQFNSVTGGMEECEDEAAGGFQCSQVDMVSFLSRYDVGARRGIQMNDVWGWEDPETGREYAIIGRTDGTSFVDLSDPANPVFVGDLPKTATANQSLWRDMKVYKDHAFIVADGAGAHHMQIFDLTQLRAVTNPPVTFSETALYKGVYSSHNIVINEETGFAYAVGSDSGGESCGGALHMIDIRDPVNPKFAGCFADKRTGGGSGTTHDAQCVIYRGPDTTFQGREICLSSNGSALSIADVTDKDSPVAISIADYPNVAYTHQGWLTEDHRYFYLNDEGDEASGLVDATRTLIFDLADLEDPVLAGQYLAKDSSIDHNLYVKGNLMYQTNYNAGLRILDISNPEAPVEVGYFDTVPYGPNDNSPVLGAWSSYPYFKSGVIVVTSGREGVFFLKKKTIDT